MKYKYFIKSKGIFLLLFIYTNYCNAQQLILPPNVAKAKLVEKKRLENKIITTFNLPIVDSTLLQYESTFWAMMTLENKPTAALAKIKFALQNFTKYDNSFQNGLLEVVYALYPKIYEKEIGALINDTTITAKQFVVCCEYLYRINKNSTLIKNVIQKKYKTHSKFYTKISDFLYSNSVSDFQKKTIDSFAKMNIYLNSFAGNKFALPLVAKKINQLQKIGIIETMKSITNNSFLPNKNILISLQNKNRNYPGIVLIRDSSGKIVTQNDTIFYTQQLARAVTNLPYYISNGNTPQGIFRINGFGVSKNNSIGPTENFQLCMPNECTVQHFFDEPILDSTWSDTVLSKLIPSKLWDASNHTLLESYIAGLLGRFEIISHGTTVNNEYYKGQPYYGFTPTAGCLQAKEIWDYNTGKRLYSDQQKLIDAYKSIGATKGYLIVLDIIDANRTVNINDFKLLIK